MSEILVVIDPTDPQILQVGAVGPQGIQGPVGPITSIDVSGGTTGLTYSGGPITSAGTITMAGTLITTNGGTGLSSYTAGDITYYATGTAFSQLAIGASTFILTSTGTAPQWSDPTSLSVNTATNIADGGANQIVFNTGSGTTSFIVQPPAGASTFLEWSGSAFQWSANPLGTVTSVDVSGGTTGLTTSGGPVTSSGTITIAGTLITSNGGTGLNSYTAGDLVYYATGTTFSKLAINSSTFILTSTGTAPQWSDPSGITVGDATNADNVAVAATSTNATYYLTFVDATTGDNAIEVDTDLTYNPSTNILTAATGNFTNVEVTNIKAKDGTAAATIADSTGVVTILDAVLTTADINGGTVDNATVGAGTPSTGAFTTLAASSTTTLNGTTIPASKTLVVTTDIGVSVQAYDAQLADVAGLTPTDGNFIVGDGTNFITEDGATARASLGLGSIATQAANSVDIDGGAVDGITLGTNSAVTEAQIDNVNINGNTISSTDTNGDLTLAPDGTGGLIVSGTNSVTVPNGTTAQRDGTPASGMLRFNSNTNEFEGYDGTAWGEIGGGGGGSTISNDTSTASDLFPIYVDATTGTAANVYTSDAQYLFKPSTGELKVKAPVASNGIVVNADTMTSNYTIDSGTNGLSVGPFTISGGVSLTIAAGQRHLIL
jgi:hypothetical protein